MFRLDNILERWAELYTPLRHNASVSGGSTVGAHSFFRISMIDANSYFVRNFNICPPTCMAYATHVNAELAQNPKAISYRHVIYFLQKQAAGDLSKTAITDDLAATEARFATDDMVQDLLAVLWAMKGVVNGKKLPSFQGGAGEGLAQLIEQTARDPEYAEGLRGLQLEQAYWGTLPNMLNGWQLCGLTIEQVTPRLLCVNPERYVQE